MNPKPFLKIILILLFTNLNAHAFSPEKRLADEKLETRARNLFLQVRCLVCNGQVIESSDTEFSFGMRELIREKISEGKNDEEIKDALKKEFGENILTEIDGKKRANLLWILPFCLAVAGSIFLAYLMIAKKVQNKQF